ncbi:MAG: DUF1801 domain-containing protein [Cyclobacteriaceae bacterium]
MKKATSVDAYIKSAEPEARPFLNALRSLIKKVAPDAEEVMSYGMPAFKYHGILVYYASFKDHYSLFPTAKPLEVFAPKLTKYKTSKGTIQFPYTEKFPEKLITEIVKFKVQENLEKLTAKQLAKKAPK